MMECRLEELAAPDLVWKKPVQRRKLLNFRTVALIFREVKLDKVPVQLLTDYSSSRITYLSDNS